jgi:hypothetical protein
MPVSQPDQKLIWGQFAGRCAICRERLIYEGAAGDRSLTGEIAHIVGERIRAARGGEQLDCNVNDPENLILLCRRHHKIVDDNPGEWTSERLHAIKREFLEWLANQLARATPWHVSISQYAYLNVPRLDELAALQGFVIDHPSIQEGHSLNQLGYSINALMSAYRRTLESMSIAAVPYAEIQFAHEDYIGAMVSFERLRFRTRNMPQYRPRGASTNFSGSRDSDPHIYCRAGEWTFAINIDPRWVTTSTAYGLFRPSGGTSVLSGFARINRVDYEQGLMIATGLALGVPSGPSDLQSLAFNVANAQLSTMEDLETKKHGREYHDEIPKCDLCGRVFQEGNYKVDGPMMPHGPWANMCASCYQARAFPLGIGQGQLYKKAGGRWPMVAGYPLGEEEEL